jgi:hypothetical protein
VLFEAACGFIGGQALGRVASQASERLFAF